MQTRKMLTFLAGFILVCVLIALGLFFVRDQIPGYLAENTPSAVVNDYLTAILRQDYERAYSYLGEWENKPDLSAFTQTVQGKIGYQYCLEIYDYRGPETPSTDLVNIFIDSYECDPEWQIDWDTFEYSEKPEISPNEAGLRQMNGQWKIERMPLPWWDAAWLP